MRAGIEAAGRLGYDAVEAFALGLAVNDPDDVSAWLAAAGVGLSAVYLDLPGDPRGAAAAAGEAAAAAARLGCSRLVVTVPRGADAVTVCGAAGEAAAARGARLCLHPHRHTAVTTAAQVDRVVAATDPGAVWVCPDTGHLLAAGDDPAWAIAAWAPRVAAVHLKDVDAAGRVVPVGTGRLAVGPVLAAIAAAAVAGGGALAHVTVEVEDMADPDAALAESRRALRRAA